MEEEIVEEVLEKPKPKRKPKIKIDLETPAKKIDYTGDFKSDLVEGNKKIFNKGDSVEKMEKSTAEFIGNTSRRIFVTAEKEEQKYVNELVSNTYYPSYSTESLSEEDLILRKLNLI